MKNCKLHIVIWLSVVLLSCCCFTACSGDSGEGLKPEIPFALSESSINSGAEGETYTIVIRNENSWSLQGEADWCKVSKSRGIGTDTVLVIVSENIFRGGRTCELVVKAQNGDSKPIQVKQSGAAKDYLYRLPVVFHILYMDESDINQNIHKNYLTDFLPLCNQLYRQGHNAMDMGVEFFMAAQDPAGKVLEEPGIHRVHWTKENVSVYDFIQSTAADDIALIWDPNKYVNVVVFRFREQSGLSAISTMPFTVSSDPLKGLRAGDAYFSRPLSLVACVAFNSQYIIRPGAGKTLAHELGHYLGLFHVFSDTEQLQTDYCGDTPNYNRAKYVEEEKRIIAEAGIDSPRLYERKDDSGTTFVSRNIMDYDYSYRDEFTMEQYKRVRHVLENSPLIPGIKKSNPGIKGSLAMPPALIAD